MVHRFLLRRIIFRPLDFYSQSLFTKSLRHWSRFEKRTERYQFQSKCQIILNPFCLVKKGVKDETWIGGMKFPTWGYDLNQTDWKRAAEIAAQKVHNANPNMLIFVGGLNYQVVLSPVYAAPIKLEAQEKLVYTGNRAKRVERSTRRFFLR